MGKISNFFAPKASTHKEFVKFAVDAHKQRLASKVLQEAEVPNKGIQLKTCGGQVILGKVNRRFAVPRSIHIKGCKKLERFLKSKKAKELYGEKLTNQGLEGLRSIRKGDKRFDPALLDCFEGFVDPDAYKQMRQQRDETTTLYSNNIDAVNALAEQDTAPHQEGACIVGKEARRDVEKAHQQAVASARLFKLTCLPQANADSVSPTQTNLANWLNKEFAAKPELKEFRASSFVDALFGAYPNKIMELNRKLDDLYAQLHAGKHDSDLLAQITNIGEQQAALIESYLRKLALVGQLLSDKFPWEEAPFGSIGIAVAAGHDLNRLAKAYLAEGSPMMEMHRLAVNAQAEAFPIREGALAVYDVRVQVKHLVEEMTPKAGAKELTREQQEYADWLNDGIAEHPVIGNLGYLMNFRWDSLNAADSETVIASIDRYLASVDALCRLAVAGSADSSLSSAQQKLLTRTGQVLTQLHQKLKDPTGPLMAIRQRALAAEAVDLQRLSDRNLDEFSNEVDDLFNGINDQDPAEGVDPLPEQEKRNEADVRAEAPDVGAMSSAELASMLDVPLDEAEPQKPVEIQPGAQWMEEFAKGIDDLLSDIPDENPISARYQPVQEAPKEASPARGIRRPHVSHFRRKPAQMRDQHAEMPTQPIQRTAAATRCQLTMPGRIRNRCCS